MARASRSFPLLLPLLVVACGLDFGTGPDEAGPDDCKVLFIGNSLTYYNDQPEMVRRLADEAGKRVYVRQATIPNATLANHAADGATLAMIREEPWDYVVLQQAIGQVAVPRLHPTLAGPIRQLRDLVQANRSDTRILYSMDYPMKYGLTLQGVGYDYAAAQKLLYAGTLELAAGQELAVAPVGWAWNTSIRERPELDLYAADQGHPSQRGSYLGAVVYFAAIFQESAEGNGYTGGLSSEERAHFQRVGSRMVLDSLGLWMLRPPTKLCGG